MWPMGRDVVVDLQGHAPSMVRQALRVNGFETDGDQCAQLSELIGGLVRFVCLYYDGEIERRLDDPAEHHSPQDLVSWAKGDLEQLFSNALQRLQARLVDALSIQLSWSRVIRCAEALIGSSWLEEICLEAAAEWRRAADVPVSSRRFARKREAHLWTPRKPDIAGVIRDYFR